MDVLKLYQDYGVQYRTEGHKHCRPGWVNCPCPFCSSTHSHFGYHLGFDLNQEYFYCWRCGPHSIWETIQLLTKVDSFQVSKLLKDYGGKFKVIKRDREEKIGQKQFSFPSNLIPLTPQHKHYLEKRNFDTKYLEKIWKIKSTGKLSLLDKKNYSNRILIPFYWNKVIVSFQGRAANEKNEYKYLACTKEREIIHHKHILYGNQRYWQKTALVIEGVTDVWRMGPESCATLGIKYKMQQVSLLAKYFDNIAIMFDGGEKQALQQAINLAAELKFRGKNAFVIKDLPDGKDPAQLHTKEARYITKQICYSNKYY